MAYFQALSIKGVDSGPCLLLVVNGHGYMFNAPEGIQRQLGESRRSPAKLRHIFMTRTSHCSVPGLIGLLMTLRDTPRGDQRIWVHGSEVITGLVMHAKYVLLFIAV